MTHPVITGSSSHNSVSGETQATITLPGTAGTGINRGDLILIHFGSGFDGNSPQLDVGEGDLMQYSKLFRSETSNQRLYTFYKRANGDEGGQVVNGGVKTADPGRVAWCYVISGADELTMPDLSASVVTLAAVNPNPPNNNILWGAADTLAVAHCICSGGSPNSITGSPTGYSGNTILTGVGTAGVGSCNSAIAWNNVTGSSEDPSAWTRNATTYVSTTTAIRPRQPATHARPLHFINFFTDSTFPNDLTVTVEGGTHPRIFCGILGDSLDTISPVLRLDPSGLNITLTPATDGTDISELDMGTPVFKWYTTDQDVPPGTYTLRLSRTGGAGGWSVYWLEIEGTDLGSDIVDVVNATGAVANDDVTGTINGQAGGLIMALMHNTASGDWRGCRVNGIAPMGFGEVANSASNRHSQLYIGRAVEGVNTFDFNDTDAATSPVTTYACLISIGYVPANFAPNAPFFGALA
jgi:hypothetical protein